MKIEGLKTYYKALKAGLGGLDGKRKKGFMKAVDGVNLMARKNSTLGVVGESGCGKTTLAKCVAGLAPPNDGKMDFMGVNVARVVEQRPVELLKELQMIFQNPDSTLNPSRSVGGAIARPLQLFGTVPPPEIRSEVVRPLKAVRLGEEYYDRLPRQLSGGEKQRVAVARAFAGRPTLVLCDEPLSALDVSVQAAVMNLLVEFQRTFGNTMLFISHDLSVVHQLCDNVGVMHLGQFREIGSTEALYAPPYPLYGGFAVRRAHSGSVGGENRHPVVGCGPERARSTLGLQVPYPLPTQDRPHMRAQAPPAARYNGGTPNLSSY